MSRLRRHVLASVLLVGLLIAPGRSVRAALLPTVTRCGFLTAPFPQIPRQGGRQAFRVCSLSMAPTLQLNQLVVVDLWPVHHPHLQRGMIVAFTYTGHPGNPTGLLIKRLIGLSGDVVRVHAGTVYVNTRPLREPYVLSRHRAAYEVSAYKVPPHVLYVLGDNRNNSDDSHSWERYPLHEDQLVGMVLVHQ